MTSALVERFFRYEYGKLVATLTRRVGPHELEAVEDAVQAALTTAIERWRTVDPPDNPAAWLFRVAHNNLTSELRQRATRRRLLDAQAVEPPAVEAPVYLAHEVQDALLQMLFVCCDEAIAQPSQIVVALKTLCGFSVRQIALRLFVSEAVVYKRLTRARERLRSRPDPFEALAAGDYDARRPAVLRIVYLLFTEGYLSVRADEAIRRELCEEALRLGYVLADHPAGQTPDTAALMALMHLHYARLDARQDAAGGLLLLEEQDRARWDAAELRRGMQWLARSATGDAYSRYHAEASIAAEHAMAPTFAETRWDRVAAAYARLEQLAPSPLHRLNRAVAVAQGKGAEAGLAELEGHAPPTWLEGSYMWPAVQAMLHQRAGHSARAEQHRRLALATAPTDAIRTLLARRFASDTQEKMVTKNLREEGAALLELARTTGPDLWSIKTQFKDWTAWDVFAHLYHSDEMGLAAVGGEKTFAAVVEEVMTTVGEGGSLIGLARRKLDGVLGPDLLERWWAQFNRMCDAFDATDPDLRLPWFGPPMKVRMFATARQMETWAHGQALYDNLGIERVETDRIRDVVYIGVKTYGFCFANRQIPAPDPMPYLVLTAPSGSEWTYGEPSETEVIRGSAVDFARVVTQTRNVADTALDVRGDGARQWMSIAQCFAGPPETPPPPKARFKTQA